MTRCERVKQEVDYGYGYVLRITRWLYWSCMEQRHGGQ